MIKMKAHELSLGRLLATGESGGSEVVEDDTQVAGVVDGGVADGGSDRFLAGEGRRPASND